MSYRIAKRSMSARIVALTCAFLLALPMGFAIAQDPGDPGTISGTVTAFAGGEGLVGVTVQALNLDGSIAGAAVTVAEDLVAGIGDGDYVIGNLPDGDYKVRAVGPDGMFVDRFFDDVQTSQGATILTLETGTNDSETGIDFDMRVFAETVGSISGTVTEAVGDTNLQGVSVQVKDPDTFMTVASATTAAGGTYTISNLEPRDYIVKFSMNGFVTDFANSAGPFIGDANVVTVDEEQVVTVDAALDLALVGAGTISGTVEDDEGDELAGVHVEALDVMTLEPVGGMAMTDANGEYTLNVPAGHYIVRFEAAGFLTQFSSGRDFILEADVVTVDPDVNAGDETGVDASLELMPAVGDTISGLVNDAANNMPLAGVRVEAIDAVDGWTVVQSAVTDPTGAYTMNVPAGNVIVRFSEVGWVTMFDSGTTFRGDANVHRVDGTDNGGITIDATLMAAPADFTSPVTTANVAGDGTAQVVVTLTAEDNTPFGGGVESTAWRLNDGPVQTGQNTGMDDPFVTTVTVTEPGTHTLTFWSVDMAGNVEVAKTVTFTVVVMDDFFLNENFKGTDRIHTAILISQSMFPDPVSQEDTMTVVIARADLFPDALAGSAIAGQAGAPILITGSAALDSRVRAEIVRLGADRVVILGGTRAISAAVATSLNAIPGVGEVHRIGGPTRFETADMIAEHVIDHMDETFSGEVFVATGMEFPDALAAGPIAGAQGMPILLAAPAGLRASTMAIINSADVDKAWILGGPVAVPAAVETRLNNALGAANVDRLQGPTRLETAVAVAEFAVAQKGHTWDMVGIARMDLFPDALAAGPLQAMSGSVILLSNSARLSTQTRAVLTANADEINEVRVFGGLVAIRQAVRDAITAIFATPTM